MERRDSDLKQCEKDLIELRGYLLYGDNMIPSDEVAERYGLNPECEIHRRENRIWESKLLAGEPYDYDKSATCDQLTLKVEKALENMEGFTPSREYLIQLWEEREILRKFACNPSSISTELFRDDVISKHGINRRGSSEEQAMQIERAYRDLDVRFVHLTGSESTAEKLFEKLRKEAQMLATERLRESEDAHPERASVSRKIR